MALTDTLRLPEGTWLPPCTSFHEASQQERILERSRTLFLPSPTGKPHPDYDYLCQPLPDGKEWFLIYKPREKKALEDYSERRYVVNVVEQTCTCPFFTGIHTNYWSDSFTVRREAGKVRIYDREGEEVQPGQKRNGFCKHVFAFLMWTAHQGCLPPSQPVSLPEPEPEPEEEETF